MYKNIEKRLNALEGRKTASEEVEDLRGLLVALGVADPEKYKAKLPSGGVVYDLGAALRDEKGRG